MKTTGVIVYVKCFNEKDALVKILSYNGTIVKGFVKGAFSKKNKPIYQIMNCVEFEWFGRENSLGSFKIDMKKQYSSRIALNRLGLLCSSALSEIINRLCDSELPYVMYDKIIDFLELVCTASNNSEVLQKYFNIEKTLILLHGEAVLEDFDDNKNYIFLQNIFSHSNTKMPVYREMLESYILNNVK